MMQARVAVAMTVALAGCAAPFFWQVPPGCSSTSDFAFNGESSFAALGISVDPEDDDRIGHIWVTRDKVPFWGSVPIGASLPEPARAACAEYPGGEGVIVDVPDSWRPPS
ncbi:MAG TPA: hypothetical protein VF153_04060 [Candidatus Limnocylindria bacterium]